MMTIVAIAKNDKLQTLDEEEDECIRDYFFDWTEDWNQFFVDNVPWKDFMIIKSSFGIDAMMLSFLLIFFCWGSTMRLPAGLIFFYPTRNVLQAVFLMGRLDGFLWSHPGLQSLTVPYFDTNAPIVIDSVVHQKRTLILVKIPQPLWLDLLNLLTLNWCWNYELGYQS